VPLIEIVSEPDLRNSAEAKAYLEGLKAILGYLDISDCRMQEGSIRCDVNVSVRPEGSDRFGTRVEMKNINSFSGAVRAIEFEAARQVAILEAGGEITQQTRRWDDMKGESFLMRTKEDAQDYRYFPEPDLGTIVVSPERIQALKDSLPELPHHRLLRFLADYGLPFADAELLVGSPDKALLFEAGVTGGASAKAAANWSAAASFPRPCSPPKNSRL
jgi:aspartyl-tRNA(Asn)/glutamyl-tRNA(Gln) amidotransferase subunit B